MPHPPVPRALHQPRRFPARPVGRLIWPVCACALALGALTAAAPGVCAQSIAFVAPAGPAASGWQALEEGRYAEAADAFERALRARPDDPMTLLGTAIVQQRLGQTARARETYDAALRIDPALTPASLLAGLLRYETGDVAGAVRIYEAALVRAPGHPQLRARLDAWLKEQALHDTFLTAQGSHFTVLFEGPADEALARAAVQVLEAAYTRIGTALLTFPLDPITVVLYTQEQFRDITRSPDWSGGAFDGRIRIPIRGGGRDDEELARVLTHEYVHALVHSVAPRGVPTWLNEGLAGAFEAGGARRAAAELAAATPAVPLPLSALASGFGRFSETEARRAYASSVLAVQALIAARGYQAITALLSDVAAGQPFAEAFATHAQLSLEDFEGQWLASFRAVR